MTQVARRRLALVLAAVASLLAALALALGGGAVQARRASSFCASCHAPEGAHRRGHANVDCQRCHGAAETGGVGLVLAAAGLRATPPHAGTRREACVDCHRRDEHRWRRLMADEGHRQHVREGAPNGCVGCHAGSLHDRPTPREGCLSCHRATPMLAEPRGEAQCTGCHTFGSRTANAARAIGHAGRTIGPQQVHGTTDCRGCHDPHRADDATSRARRADCVRCHAGRHAAEVAAGPPGHRDCLGCHAPHAPRSDPALDCARCHATPPPRAPGLPVAPDVAPLDAARVRAWLLHVTVVTAPPTSGATPPPAPVPEGVHGGRCVSCHRPHTWEARRDDCRGCHATQATQLARVPTPAHQDCASCHDPHGRAPDANTCRGCHQEPAHRNDLAAPVAHRDCMSCHAPHGARADARQACDRCHAPMNHALVAGPVAHRDCAACHATHGPPAAHPTEACASCHGPRGTAAVEAPRSEGHARCEGCHRPHAFTRTLAAQTCEGCHQATLAHADAHAGGCETCHAPHDAARDRAHECASCHAAVHVTGTPRALAGHARCQSCHAPHRDARAAREACDGCHRAEAATSASWSGHGPHGGDCATCHAPHRAGGTTTCDSCHAQQARPEHTGTHRQCADCHSPHAARPTAAQGGWWSGCASCHRAEASAAATASGTHRNCADCHDRPNRAAPACGSCHAAVGSTLLHATPHHGRCADCHASHGTAAPARSQCLSCHADRATHFPDAPRCQSCHPFSAPR